jgi:hypothetical protein
VLLRGYCGAAGGGDAALPEYVFPALVSSRLVRRDYTTIPDMTNCLVLKLVIGAWDK